MYPYTDTDEYGNPIEPIGATSSLRVLSLSDQVTQDKAQDIGFGDRANISLKAGLYGMANNFISLGKWTGLADEETELYDVKQILSDERYDLGLEYAANENLYNLAGDLAFSLVPGGAAMWGLRAMKNASTIGKGVASMMNFGGARAYAAKEAISDAYKTLGSAAGATDNVKKLRRSVIGYTVAQEAFDGAVTTAAVELTLNTGTELNTEGVSTATALGHLGTSMLFGAGFQGLLGGAFGAVSRLGETKKVLGEVVNGEINHSYRGYVSQGAGYEGDDVAKIVTEVDKLHSMTPANKPEEIARETALAQAERVLKESVAKATASVTEGLPRNAPNPLRSSLLAQSETPEGRKALVELMQGSEGGFRPIHANDLRSVDRLGVGGELGKRVATSVKAKAEAGEDAAAALGANAKALDLAEYDRVLSKVLAHDELTPYDADAWITLKGKSVYAKAEANPKFKAEMGKLLDDLEYAKGNELDDFAAMKHVYDAKVAMDGKAFSKAYPEMNKMFKSLGAEEARQIFGRKSTLFFDTVSGTAHEAPARTLGNVTKHEMSLSGGSITYQGLGDSVGVQTTVKALGLGKDHSEDLLQFQAQRVLGGRVLDEELASKGFSKVGAGGGAAGADAQLSAAEVFAIEKSLMQAAEGIDALVPDSSGMYVLQLGRKQVKVEAADLHESLAQAKSLMFNKLQKANPNANASELARSIGVSEKFILSRGLHGDVRLATGDAYRVGLRDMVSDAGELTQKTSYALDYSMPNMTYQANADIYAHMASESAKLAMKNREDVANLFPELSAGMPASLPMEDVSGYGTRRFLGNSAQIGSYQGLVAKASYINDTVQTQNRAAYKGVTEYIRPSAEAMFANRDAAAEYAAHVEWYSQVKGGQVRKWGDDALVRADIADELIKAGAKSGDMDALKGVDKKDFWKWNTAEAKNVAADLQAQVRDVVTKPKGRLMAIAGRVLDTHPDNYYLPPRTYEHATYIVERGNPIAGESKKVYRIVGDTAEDLRAKVAVEKARATADGRKVFEAPPTSVNEYKEAQRLYEWSGDARLDQMRSAGADSKVNRSGQVPNAFPETDAKLLLEEQAAWFMRQIESNHGNAVEIHFAEEFRMLRELARQADAVASTDLGRNRFATVLFGDGVAKQRKASDWEQVLTLAKGGDVGNLNLWGGINNFVEDIGAGVGTKIREGWKNVRKVSKEYREGEAAKMQAWDDEAEAVRSRLAESGINLQAGNYLAERAARETRLEGRDFRLFVGSANMLQATAMFRLDLIDTYVNVLGSIVKAGGEIAALKKIAAARGTTGVLAKEADELFGAGKIVGPPVETVENVLSQWSPAKAIAQGFKFMFSDQRHAKIEEWIKADLMMDTHGLTSSAFDAARLDVTSIHTSADAVAAAHKYRTAVSKVVNTLAKPADFSNLAIQVGMLHMAERLGTAAGLQGKELHTFMSTFNRRVNAVTNPSQKPRLFQGAAGMALSLYQSYQFHMLNNLFRYAEGGVRTAPAAIAALNAGFFGAQSVPGFQQMNAMIAERNGAKGHTDMYGALAKVLGSDAESRDMFDFALYGAGSWALQNNTFVRGDMNPRAATLIPTSMADIPAMQAFKRVVDGSVTAASRMAHGESWVASPLEAVVGMGFNRPLRGLAEVARGRSIDGSASTVVYHDDVLSLATLNRLAGARPIDEAIVRDYQSRFYVNKAASVEAKKNLSGHIKRMYAESPEAVNNPDNIARWQMIYQKANGSLKNWENYMRDQTLKVDDDLSQRLEDAVKKSPDSLAQYRAIIGY